MKLITHTFVLVFVGAHLFNCTSDNVVLEKAVNCEENSGILITSTKVCGWFPNYDSMAIDSQSLRYYNYCLKSAPAKEYPITCEKWSLLISKLDIEKFWELTINSCNLCVDGCDISISVEVENRYHRIKFGPNEIPISIKDFVESIEALRADLKSKTCS